jgi:hypothetical protein
MYAPAWTENGAREFGQLRIFRDDIFYNSGRHLVFVAGGEVIRQNDLHHYQPVRRITPAPGARTGFLVPGFNRRCKRVGEQEASSPLSLRLMPLG